MKAQFKFSFAHVSTAILLAGIMILGPGFNADAKAAADKVYTLKLAHHMPPTAIPAQAIEKWVQKIQEKTNNRVQITTYASGSLVKPMESLASTAAGICDMYYVPLMFEARRLGLNCIVNMTALPIATDNRGIAIWNKLWEKYPEMLKEFSGVKPLHHTVAMSVSLHTLKQVRVPDDIKRMKITALGDGLKLLKAAGASPVGMSSNDWYMSMEKGVIEGILAPVAPLTDRGIQELIKYHVDLGMGQGGNVMIINEKVWNSFPADIQAVFQDLEDYGSEAMIQAHEKVMADAWQKCAGQTIIKLTPEEKKLWLDCARPAAEEWIKANAKKGPTEEMFAYVQKLIAEVK